MADQVYISKNLNQKQLQFIKLLEDYEISYFDMKEIEHQINQSFKNLNEILENLVDKDLLRRIAKGKYALRNYQNINVLATFISKESSVGYWSALHYHGLTERFPNTVFVKMDQRKRDTEILGAPIQFITVKKEKNMGQEQKGYGGNSFPMTDIEMTLVDCFDQPRYAGDFPDLIKAFAQANLTNKRLIKYTKTYNNIALIKRMGFLAELFHKEKLKSFIHYAKTKVNKRYNLIDAGGLEEGEFVKEWKLRLNVSRTELLQMAETEY